MSQFAPGTIGWMDLTIPDAEPVRRFYESVVGWASIGVDMGGYKDFAMTAPDSDRPVAGICHARGVNTGVPPCWLLYVSVPDLDAALARVRRSGGDVVGTIRAGGGGRYCVIQDPSGAFAALYQSDSPPPPATKTRTAKRATPSKSAKKSTSKRPARGRNTVARSSKAKASPRRKGR
ncbi:MAG: VOC family protein [Phycisphaerales bacterium]